MMIHFFHEGFDSKYGNVIKYISYKITALRLSKSRFRSSDKIQNLDKVSHWLIYRY